MFLEYSRNKLGLHKEIENDLHLAIVYNMQFMTFQ